MSHIWRRTYDYKKLVVCRNKTELLENYKEIARQKLEVMVQEIMPGGDDQIYEFYSYLNRDSEPLAIFTKKKIRQNPVHFGIGCF